jgi:hypothetical protein
MTMMLTPHENRSSHPKGHRIVLKRTAMPIPHQEIDEAIASII